MTDLSERYWNSIDAVGETGIKFLRKNWFESWLNLVQSSNSWTREIKYIYVGEADNDCAIIPYAYQKVGPLKFASLPGAYFPHRGILNTGPKVILIEKAAEKLSELSGIYGFRMGPVESSDLFISGLTEKLKQNGWKIITMNIGANYGMVPPATVEEYLSGFSANRRQKMRSNARKMDALGKVELKHFNDVDNATWEQIFKDIEIVESNAWVSKTGEPRFVGLEKQFYWNELVKDEFYKKALSVWILYLDDKPVSKKVALDAGGIRYYLTSSYDEKVARFNTGVRMEVEFVSDAIVKGIKYINNGLGDSGYKTQWGSEYYNDLIDIIAFPPTIKGRFAYLLAKLKAALGR
ncbi:MAG: GNAT family N-acetyltransferase [Kordiimonadaceae bacterium]|nr:GNAT family N-acetyltransferase [Kordiimonadaceae bacterium]